jgi:hypothetical protein
MVAHIRTNIKKNQRFVKTGSQQNQLKKKNVLKEV